MGKRKAKKVKSSPEVIALQKAIKNLVEKVADYPTKRDQSSARDLCGPLRTRLSNLKADYKVLAENLDDLVEEVSDKDLEIQQTEAELMECENNGPIIT